jgi:hypothetical protein
MASEALVPAQAPSGAPSEDEYQTFCAALSASARGRAFLAEYARRHRGADTEVLLAALARLEALIRSPRAGTQPTREELRALLSAVRTARPEIAACSLPARAAKLAQLLDMLEQRIEALVEPAPQPALAGDTRLAVVPPPDEPELPIPSPSAAQPALTLAHDRGPPLAKRTMPENDGAAVITPEVTWFDGPPPEASGLEDAEREVNDASPSMAEKVAALTPQPGTKPPPAAPVMPPPADPLAPLMLLSEEERLALFT